MKKAIIFDFDGTLADTLDAVVRVANRISSEYGFDKIKRADLPRLRQESPFDILKQFHISPLRVPAIIKRGRREFTKEISKIDLIDGIQNVLKELKKRDFMLGILTSNSKKNIEQFLARNDIQVFDFIQGDIGIFGKKRGLKKLLKEKNLMPEDVVYIGDEIRDIEGAKKVGITIISVSWGFNTHEFLAQHNPDFLVDTPSKLLETIERLK